MSRETQQIGKFRCRQCGEILRPCGDEGCDCYGVCACFSVAFHESPTCPVCGGDIGRELHSDTDHERRRTPYACEDCGRKYRLQRVEGGDA